MTIFDTAPDVNPNPVWATTPYDMAGVGGAGFYRIPGPVSDK